MIAMIDCGEIAEMVPPYLEKALSSEECAAIDAHLASCPSCRDSVERFKRVDAMARNTFGEGTLSADFKEKTGERMRVISSGPMPTFDEDEEELVVAPQQSWLDSMQESMGSAPWWIISGAFHALVLLLVTLIGMALLRQLDEDVVIVTDLEKQKELEEIEPPEKRDVFKKPIPLEETEVVSEQQPIFMHEEVEVAEEVETDNDSDAQDTRGEDGISDVWLGGSGNVAALGLGGGGGGAFGRPGGAGGRLRRAIRGGGGRATESAVDKALEWLARHQHADGSWHVKELEGSENWDPGVTALATLAFLGAGHTEKIGKYKNNVTAAIKYLIGQQKANGAIGDEARWYHCGGCSYHHAIGGMALAEASAMARVPATIAAAQKAITYTTEIHQCGTQSDKYGWRYKPKDRGGDMSNVGWFVMQLKSAKVAGLNVDPASFEGALKWLDKVEADKVAVKKTSSSFDTGGHRYGYTDKTVTVNNTSMGILCRLFTGTRPEEVAGACQWLLETEPPRWDAKLGPGAHHNSFPMYYLYYTTLVSFQVGGDIWKRWNQGMKTVLVNNQRKDGDADGSWDPLAKHEIRAGRAYTTAMGAMCLEVYYRYLPMYRE